MEIRHELTIKASSEVVYNAVATQTGIQGWWSKECQVGEQVGAPSTLNFDKQGTLVVMGFKTLELLFPLKVVWECTENANPAWLGTKIITEIQPNSESCQVVFSHSGFDEKWKGQDPFEMTRDGWQHFVASLVSFCETGEGQPW